MKRLLLAALFLPLSAFIVNCGPVDEQQLNDEIVSVDEATSTSENALQLNTEASDSFHGLYGYGLYGYGYGSYYPYYTLYYPTHAYGYGGTAALYDSYYGLGTFPYYMPATTTTVPVK